MKLKIGYIIASHQVTMEKRPIGWFYREQPDNDQDSGWRVFSGDESEAYLLDAANLSFYNASTIVSLEPELALLLGRDFPAAFERDPVTGVFVELDEPLAAV